VRFGSVDGVRAADLEALEGVIGRKVAADLWRSLHAAPAPD
jgi:hypothetical protein